MSALPESSITRAEVRSRLAAFAARWDQRPGNEQQEAQQFLLELLQCYGIDTSTVPSPFTFEHHYGDGSRADLYWPGLLLVEMKSAGESARLPAHREQAFGYWRQSDDPAAGVPSPRWLLLCSFKRFEVWQPGEFPRAPRANLDLIDLPDRLEVLDFLRGREAAFDRNAADLAGEAVAATAGVYQALIERGTDPVLARDFTLQAAWCMFAEDLGLLPEDNFSAAIRTLRSTPGLSSYDHLGELFEWLNREGERPSAGMFQGVPYADGGLFAAPARVELHGTELELLSVACRADWSLVEPSIFGGLLQSSLGIDRRWKMGAHYTPEAEIEKIVRPTIVEPWSRRIDGLESLDGALAALDDLASFRVLDPACGCGNFLYVAYRELRRLEVTLKTRIGELSRSEGRHVPDDLPAVPLSNMFGIERDPFAAGLAQVVLWIGHKLAVDHLRLPESTLPLPKLSGIVQGDALAMPWPECDAIVGNPPFHGTKHMRSVMGGAYLEFLRREFGVGVTDYCVYWFRKANERLATGRRAGLVATNSIADGKNREAALDPIVAGGKITQAIRSQPWPGEANVFVSIVNWVKGSDDQASPVLDGREVEGITSELRPGRARPSDQPLAANKGRQFFGVVPGAGGDGFILTELEARELLSRTDADYSQIVHPYLIGDDITTDPHIRPRRWIIDFAERPLEEAELWPAALAIVRERVKPARDAHKKQREREQWWKFSRTVQDLFRAVRPLSRFIACPATSKRVFMVWCEPDWRPSNATSAFAFDDDFALGVLQSSIRLCAEQEIGLTRLYNAVAEGAHSDLAALHRDLDESVGGAYGWPPAVAHDGDEIVRRLGEMNAAITAGRRRYAPFPQASAETLFADLQEPQ